MALKLNIRPDIEEEMEALMSKVSVRSKTEYINLAIGEYNRHLKREIEINRLKNYYKTYQKEAKEILHEFSKLQNDSD